MIRILLSLLVILAGCSQPAPKAAVEPAPEAQALSGGHASAEVQPEERAKLAAEINERFLDPKLDYERWKKNFEGESREVYRARDEILSALEILPGQSVADIGAGTGFYLWAFAERVGSAGRVYGVEIAPRFLEKLGQQVEQRKLANATIVEGTMRSVELSESSVDLVFICDTYHHFEYPQSTLASIKRALRPGGALVIIDFHRVPGKSPAWILDHVRAGQAEFTAEIESAGFVFESELAPAGLKDNYVIRFRKPRL